MKKYIQFIIILILLPFCKTTAQSLLPVSNISTAGTVDSFKGGYTFSYATAGSPWNGSLISYGGFSNQYDCQISSDYGPAGGKHISFRTKNGDTNTWNPWYEILHSGNLNSFDFFRKTVASISAASSVNDFVNGYTFSYATSGTPWNGALMSFGGFGNQYDCQISSDYGSNGGNHISFRTKNGDVNTWNSWNEIWNSSNLNRLDTDFNAKNIFANVIYGQRK